MAFKPFRSGIFKTKAKAKKVEKSMRFNAYRNSIRKVRGGYRIYHTPK